VGIIDVANRILLMIENIWEKSNKNTFIQDKDNISDSSFIDLYTISYFLQITINIFDL
jgi:hypothetical protein